MSISVRIPTPLRRFTGGADTVSILANNVGELLDNLEDSHPGLKSRVCDRSGKVRRFVNIFVRDEDIRYLDNLNTSLTPGDEVSIVPAIAGGR
jgi:molybdopterin synthase sulfur carrier subunit